MLFLLLDLYGAETEVDDTDDRAATDNKTPTADQPKSKDTPTTSPLQTTISPSAKPSIAPATSITQAPKPTPAATSSKPAVSSIPTFSEGTSSIPVFTDDAAGGNTSQVNRQQGYGSGAQQQVPYSGSNTYSTGFQSQSNGVSPSVAPERSVRPSEMRDEG